MKKFITFYPYATQTATLDIPEDVDDVNEYIREHWSEIEFDEVELDYCGTDFDMVDDDDDDDMED